MRLSFTKFTEPLSPTSKLKTPKKPRSRLKNKNKVTYISSSLKVRKQQPVSDISQILLTTRQNFITPYQSSKLDKTVSISRLNKSLTKQILPVPSLNLRTIKKRNNFFDNDKLITQRTLPTICKTNLREQIQISRLNLAVPIVHKDIKNIQQYSIQSKLMFDQQFQFVSTGLQAQPTASPSSPITKILGNAPSDLIIKRFKALNNSLLRPQRIYQGRKFKSKDIVQWKY